MRSACVLESMRSRKRALKKACAQESVRSGKRALKKACAQESVRSKSIQYGAGSNVDFWGFFES